MYLLQMKGKNQKLIDSGQLMPVSVLVPVARLGCSGLQKIASARGGKERQQVSSCTARRERVVSLAPFPSCGCS